MALRKSRRERRIETEKRLSSPEEQQPFSTLAADLADRPNGAKPVIMEEPRSLNKVVNFATEYYYVYHEVRNIAVISVALFALMFGLSYFI